MNKSTKRGLTELILCKQHHEVISKRLRTLKWCFARQGRTGCGSLPGVTSGWGAHSRAAALSRTNTQSQPYVSTITCILLRFCCACSANDHTLQVDSTSAPRRRVLRVVDGSSNSVISQPRMRDILPCTSFRECFSALEMDGVALQYATVKAFASTPDDSALRIDNMEDVIHETIDDASALGLPEASVITFVVLKSKVIKAIAMH